jgi:glycosyltransferase involved in cell wall biosynthesis
MQRKASKLPVIAIGIAFHSKSQPLPESVESAVAQSVPGHDIHIIVLDSTSEACAGRILRKYNFNRRVHIVPGASRSAFAARNRLIQYAERKFPTLRWHVRLDADDRFTSYCSLAAVTRSAKLRHRIVLAGNRQLGPGDALVGLNLPSDCLLGRSGLMSRLKGMAVGVFKDELPSCNLIMRAGYGWRYPAKPSAEDHWLLASLLLRLPRAHVHICKEKLIDYRVGGSLTSANKKRGLYLAQRVKLLEAAEGWRRDA